VWDSERAAGEIAANFAMSWPAVSQHLRVLKDAGLVEERREGRRRFYSVRKEALGSLREILEETWDTSLARLKSAAEAEEAERGPDGE
jgi:DNA-binding transcriptional ArsR family regulator